MLISCIVFANLLFVNGTQSQAAGLQNAKVTASILNVRSTPTTKATILWKLSKGQQVQITQTGNGWSKIRYPNKKDGWVNSSYISVINQPAAVSSKTLYVTATSLNLRKAASVNSTSLTLLKKNAKVTELSRSGSWSKIKYSSYTGYVSNKYLTAKAPVSAPKKPAAVVAAKPKTLYVSASSLNLRKAATVNSASLTILSKNTKVSESSRSGSWSKITYKSYTGYVSNKYLTSTAPAPAAAKPAPAPSVPAKPASSVEYVKIITNDVNLRSGPGEKYSILDKADTGEKFRKLGSSSGWIQIELPDKRKAWVADWLITYNVSNTRGLKGKTIVLDAGHGGTDSGAVGYSPSLKKAIMEKDLTFKMVQKTAIHLRNAGANVILTRSTDVKPSLQARVDIAEKYRADAFVSVHYNSGSASSTGVETFYYSQSKDKRLADCIQKEMVKASALRDRGVKKGDLHVIRENSRPAVLLELGFISNKAELDKILADSFQDAMSLAIYNGLKTYFN
ncbi:hypothetical protein CUU66_03560 [Peribacillus deserti]|uniref:SH3b domain-containing protein n=2 Tax=Peribacillus deserti TaxID=673318 RepID=A0A2N5MAD7_9BACI|nr:hypothetical protein CUU66_03560 [Peribacillus deserti]